MIKEDIEYCHKCKKETSWILRGKRLKCEGCGDVYPCRSSCEHLDCQLDKKNLNE